MRDPTCRCDGYLRHVYINAARMDGGDERDGDVDVYEVDAAHPVVQYHPAFEPLVATCPHGVTWCLQPTGDQRQDWANRGVR